MTDVSKTADGNAAPVTWATASDEQRKAWLLQMELDYCTGIKPTRQIGEECGGVSHTFVNKEAKKRGWERDLTAKIRAKADAKVSKAAVSKEDSKKRAATEAAVVEANATLQYQVRMAHRKDIARGRAIWDQLCGELEATGFGRDEIEKILAAQGEEMTARQRDDARQTLKRMVGHPSRVASFNTLVHSLERLVKLERQAFGIAVDDPDDNPAGAAGAAAAAAAGASKALTDAERAVRLLRLWQATPGIQLPGPAA